MDYKKRCSTLEIRYRSPWGADVTVLFHEHFQSIDDEKMFIDRVRCALDEAFCGMGLDIMKPPY